MQTTIALLALAAASAVSAQGIAAGTLKPSTASPAGCSQNYAGNFEITVVTPSKKRDLEKRQSACAASGVAVLSLANGILTDSAGRIGGIVANRQFQFDGPPSQTGTIYNGGWSVCSNGSIAIGGNAQFYQCGSGSFYNLYDTNIGAQCSPILIDIIPCTVSSGSAAVSSGVVAVSTKSDGQPVASKATTAAVSQITDGQVQAQSAKPISQYTDGQLQGTAMATVTKAPVSQISDGQIQATSKAPAATTMATTTAKPVSQISDGQIQAASTTLTKASATTSAVYTGAAAAVTPLAGLAAVAALAAML